MNHFFHIEGIAGALGLLGIAWAVMKWIYSRVKVRQDLELVVRYLYTNHLPHIDKALRLICQKLEIPYDDPPQPPILG